MRTLRSKRSIWRQIPLGAWKRNKSRAAAVLGITRQTLYQRLRAYGLIDDYSRRARR